MAGEGLTAPEYHRKLSISSTASPQAFKHFSIEMPDTVREAYDAQFREEVLDDLQDVNNWERIGRKNAFKHTTGAAVNILKDGNVYKATFTDLHNKGVYFTSVTGDTLTARLENALQKLHPNEFAHRYWGQIPDLLRAELGQEVQITKTEPEADTPTETGG